MLCSKFSWGSSESLELCSACDWMFCSLRSILTVQSPSETMTPCVSTCSADGAMRWGQGLHFTFVDSGLIRCLNCKAGFMLGELTSGLTLGFQSSKGEWLLTGLYHRGNSCWTPNLLLSRLCLRSAGTNAPPTDQSDQSVLVELRVQIMKESLRKESEFTERQTSDDFY